MTDPNCPVCKGRGAYETAGVMGTVVHWPCYHCQPQNAQPNTTQQNSYSQNGRQEAQMITWDGELKTGHTILDRRGKAFIVTAIEKP